jgi:hypothetical protein
MAQLKPEVSSVQAPINVYDLQAARPMARNTPVSGPSGIVPIRGAPDAPSGDDTLTLSPFAKAAAGLTDGSGRAEASGGALQQSEGARAGPGIQSAEDRPPRIGDPGWAKEVAEAANRQIAQNPQSALLAQANVPSQVALSLLG